MKVKNFLITGPPRSGKTTLLMEIINQLKKEKLKISGITCPEIRQGGTRKGFKIVNLETGEEGTLAEVNPTAKGPKIGKYTVNLEDLDEIGTKTIIDAVENEADVVIIDEIGVMELQSKKFQQAVKKALNSNKPVVGIIHRKSNHPLLQAIRRRQDTKIYQIERTTGKTGREQIKKDIVEKVLQLANKNQQHGNQNKNM